MQGRMYLLTGPQIQVIKMERTKEKMTNNGGKVSQIKITGCHFLSYQ